MTQSVVLAGVSCVVGVPAGLLLARLMNWVTPALHGQDVPFTVSGWFVLSCVVGVVLLAALAALGPARRAARLSVIDALRYE
jgi:ABC-type antimicrobial peptide transport system permease subunit